MGGAGISGFGVGGGAVVVFDVGEAGGVRCRVVVAGFGLAGQVVVGGFGRVAWVAAAMSGVAAVLVAMVDEIQFVSPAASGSGVMVESVSSSGVDRFVSRSVGPVRRVGSSVSGGWTRGWSS